MNETDLKQVIDEIKTWKKKVGGFYPDATWQKDEEGRKQYNKAITDVVRYLETLND
jgi:hypothetical protein